MVNDDILFILRYNRENVIYSGIILAVQTFDGTATGIVVGLLILLIAIGFVVAAVADILLISKVKYRFTTNLTLFYYDKYLCRFIASTAVRELRSRRRSKRSRRSWRATSTYARPQPTRRQPSSQTKSIRAVIDIEHIRL
jgi:hypothetical protein